MQSGQSHKKRRMALQWDEQTGLRGPLPTERRKRPLSILDTGRQMSDWHRHTKEATLYSIHCRTGSQRRTSNM